MRDIKIPHGWSKETIETLASTVTSGGTPESGNPRYYSAAGHLFAKIDDLTAAPSRYIRETQLSITDAALRESVAKIYPPGTILVSMYGTIGLVKTTVVPMAANQALAALIPPFRCNSDYLAHYLAWSRERLAGSAAQTTQANISGAIIKAFEVNLPSHIEQCCIAEILDTLDETIHETEQLIAKLKQLKQGLLHDLLTRGIDENGELRNPERHPEQFKTSPLGWIPKAWNAYSLRRCLEADPQNGIYKPASAIGRGVLLVGQTSFTESRTIDFALARRAMVSAFELERFGLRTGDVLVSRVFATVDGVGQPALVPPLNEPAVYESNMMRLRANNDVINHRMVFHWLLSSQLRRQIATVVNSSNQASINQVGINGLLIAVPPRSEQVRILDVLRAQDVRQEKESDELAKLRLLKQGLMEDLLTGRVRVTPLLAESTP